MVKKYKLTQTFQRDNLPKDTVVWDCVGYDYGLSSEDTRYTGVKHISVTFNPNGDYPGFTIPLSILEELPADLPKPGVGTPEWWNANKEAAKKYYKVDENDDFTTTPE